MTDAGLGVNPKNQYSHGLDDRLALEEGLPSRTKGDAHVDLVRRWYRPIEIDAMVGLLGVALLVNLVLLPIEVVRGVEGGLLHAFEIAALVWLWTAARSISQRIVGMSFGVVTAGGCLLAAALSLRHATLRAADGPLAGLTVWDLWSAAWAIAPAVLALVAFSGPIVVAWSMGTLSTAGAERGLARNAELRPHFERAASHIALAHAVAVVVIPLIWILDVALSPGDVLGGTIGDAMTGEHFAAVLGGESFWIWMRNSVAVSVGTTLLGLGLAIPAGYAFSRYRFRGRDTAMFSFLLVQMFPGVIILVPYFLVMKSLGLLNTWAGLILAYSVTALPLCVWMLKGFFDTVPKELEEAALLDGCDRAQVFRKVVLPLSMPAIAVTALFSFLAAWNEFLLALTFNTSNEMYTLPVGLASMISATGQAWGDFAAASILVSLPVAALFIIFQRFLIQGLSAGGVKG